VVARTEFIRTLQLEPWPADGLVFDVAADADEREGLRRRFDLLALDRLVARGEVSRTAKDAYLLRGMLAATVAQTCVISLEPVAGEIEQPFEIVLRRPEEDASDVVLDPEAPDAVPLLGDEVDLGELLAEELALALDPYPHAPDAHAQLPPLGPAVVLDGPEQSERPFAALGGLRETMARQR
jgi:uncharacterized metal-binding protein YceD (DUF177 family)